MVAAVSLRPRRRRPYGVRLPIRPVPLLIPSFLPLARERTSVPAEGLVVLAAILDAKGAVKVQMRNVDGPMVGVPSISYLGCDASRPNWTDFTELLRPILRTTHPPTHALCNDPAGQVLQLHC